MTKRLEADHSIWPDEVDVALLSVEQLHWLLSGNQRYGGRGERERQSLLADRDLRGKRNRAVCLSGQPTAQAADGPNGGRLRGVTALGAGAVGTLIKPRNPQNSSAVGDFNRALTLK